MAKLNAKNQALWNAYTERIVAARAANDIVEVSILDSTRSAATTIPSKRPRYQRAMTNEQIEAHFRNFVVGALNGQNPYIAEMTIEVI